MILLCDFSKRALYLLTKAVCFQKKKNCILRKELKPCFLRKGRVASQKRPFVLKMGLYSHQKELCILSQGALCSLKKSPVSSQKEPYILYLFVHQSLEHVHMKWC